MTGAAEHDGLAMRANLVRCQCHLFGAVDAHEPMLHTRHVGLALANLMSYRVVLVAIGEDLHLFAKRCREQHRLAIAVGLVEDALDDRQEAHIGHAVGLVDNGIADLIELDLALLNEVDKAAGAGNEHVDAVAKRLQLLAESHAAVDRSNRTASLCSERFEFAADLFSELAGGGEDEACWMMRASVLEAHDHWNTKGQRLTRTGGCSAQHVLASERIGDRRSLDLEGRRDAGTIERGDDIVGHAKFGK